MIANMHLNMWLLWIYPGGGGGGGGGVLEFITGG